MLAALLRHRIVPSPPPMPDPTIASFPYAEFQAELAEIHRHKWLASEKEGRDVGFERALTDWASKHREMWRKERNRRPQKNS